MQSMQIFYSSAVREKTLVVNEPLLDICAEVKYKSLMTSSAVVSRLKSAATYALLWQELQEQAHLLRMNS